MFARTADADVATLWAIGTYLMDTWRLWPRLTITSPTRQCGKTTLLEVLEAVVMRGLAVSNATSASIFRAIEGWRPTLLCDEADTWMKDDKELSGVLNSGHTRRTARVIRTEENKSGERVPTLFSTWAAMVIAGIGSQRDTLMSRSIVVSLARKLPGESVERMPSDLHERMLRVRRQILRWTNDNKVRIGAMDVEPPACGDDRRLDNHTPVWRVALALGGPWPDRIAAAYAAGSPAGAEAEEPTNVLLLGDVHDTFVRHGASRISTSDLLQELLGMLDRPWLDLGYGRPLNQYGLAKMLRPFDVRPRTHKFGADAKKGYIATDVAEAYARYCAPIPPIPPVQSVTPQPDNEIKGLSGNQSVTGTPSVTDWKSRNQLENNEGCGVTDQTSPVGACADVKLVARLVRKPDTRDARAARSRPGPMDPDVLDPDAWGMTSSERSRTLQQLKEKSATPGDAAGYQPEEF